MFRGLVLTNDWRVAERRREQMAAAEDERRLIEAEKGATAMKHGTARAGRASTLAMAALLGATLTIVGQVIADPVAGLFGAAADNLVTTLLDEIGPDEVRRASPAGQPEAAVVRVRPAAGIEERGLRGW